MMTRETQIESGRGAHGARPSRSPRVVAALLALCAIIVPMMGPLSPTIPVARASTIVAACSPAVAASALHVAPAQTVILTGSCFKHTSPITIHWGSAAGHTIESTSTNAGGGFTQDIVIPSDATDGPASVVAIDGSGTSASYTFTIVVPVANITLSKSTAAPSDSITVFGHGFSAHSHIDFTLDDGTQLGSSTMTNAAGAFNVPVPLPLALSNGPTHITATDAHGRTALAALTVKGGTSASCDFWCSVATTFFGTIMTIMLAPITAVLLLIAKLVDASTGSLWSYTPPELSYQNPILQSFHTTMLFLGAGLIVLYVAYMGLMMGVKRQRSFGDEGPAEVIWRIILTVGFMAASWEFFQWSVDLFNGLTRGLGGATFDSFFTDVSSSVSDPNSPNQLLYMVLLIVMSIMILILTVKMAIRLAYLDVVAGFMPLMAVFMIRPESASVAKAWIKEYMGTLIAQFVTVATLKLGIGLMQTSMTMAMPHGGSPTMLGFIVAIGVFVLAIQISKRFERVIGAVGVHASPLTMLLGAAALQKGASGGVKAATAIAGIAGAPHMALAGATKGFMAGGFKGAAAGAGSNLAKAGRMVTGAPAPRPGGAAGAAFGGAGSPGAAALARAASPVPMGGAVGGASGGGGGTGPTAAPNARAFAQSNPGLAGMAIGSELLQNYQGQRDPSFTPRNGNALSRKEIPSFVEAAGYDPGSTAGQQFQSYLNQHEDAGTLTPENAAASFAAVAADDAAGTTPADLGTVQAQDLPMAASLAAMGGAAALAGGYTPAASSAASTRNAAAPSIAGMSGTQAWQAWAPSRSHTQAAAARGQNVMGRKEIAPFVAAAAYTADSDGGKQLSYYMGKHENAGTLTAENLAASVDATTMDAAAGATPSWGHGVQTQQAPTAAMAQAHAALDPATASAGWSANYAALASAAPSGRGGGAVGPPPPSTSSAVSSSGAGGSGSVTLPYTPGGGSSGYSAIPWQMPANLAAANKSTMGSWTVGGMAWAQHTRQAGVPGVPVADHFNPTLPEADLQGRASAFAQSFGYGDTSPATEAIAANVMDHVRGGSMSEDNIRAVGAMAVEDQWAGRLDTPTRGTIIHKDLGRAANPRNGLVTP